MSSKYVRDQIKSYLLTNLPGEKIVDFTARFKEWQEFIINENISEDLAWYALQFQADPETPITIGATNTSGKYREEGIVSLHIVEPVIQEETIIADNLVNRGETIKNLFRGKRIGDIIITLISQLNTESGATLQFSGGFQSGTILIFYQRDLDL